ncbi:MAG: ROK family protein [Anaerolineales bacterium]|nr:ROK family protein [Anaerolineales bacterium]MCX7607701.1 ROK family protein [Anaerolineales bacterium]MDW8227150.1 ROK family protein [Anaerolineales bacterium]
MKPPRRTIDLRQVNSQSILRALSLGGPMSRLELSARTQLSPGTVTNVTNDLLEEGLLLETGVEESLGGRPRTILDVNPEYGYLLGVDLGETHVQIELFDLSRRKLATTRQQMRSSISIPDEYVQAIALGVKDLGIGRTVERSQILGVGVGVPGIVEHNGPVSVAAPMWGWRPMPLLEMLENALQLPVYIDNGAKAMALAEAWFGAGRGVENLVVLLIGTGVGAGIITKGALYRGATNSAGEWGHTKLVLDGRPCRCGSRGCLETYVGAPGILTTAAELGLSADLPDDQMAAFHTLVRLYQEGRLEAQALFRQTAQMLGAGLANLVNLFNPQRIVLGGWAGMLLGEILLGEITQAVRAYSLTISMQPLEIRTCYFGQDAICVGAACLVLEEVLSLNPKFMRRRAL